MINACALVGLPLGAGTIGFALIAAGYWWSEGIYVGPPFRKNLSITGANHKISM